MATLTVRSTLALDPETETSIQRLAKLWKASKAEVVRRSIAAVERAEEAKPKLSPLDALDWLQANGKLTESKVQSWCEESLQLPA